MEPKLKILYAEDEPLIAAMVEDGLVEAGFQVFVAHDGHEAEILLAQHGDSLDGFITDVRLGNGPDGWELARTARTSNPSLPVIYTTGDSAHLWGSEGVPMSVAIQKPFVEAQVLLALTSLLNDNTRLGLSAPE